VSAIKVRIISQFSLKSSSFTRGADTVPALSSVENSPALVAKMSTGIKVISKSKSWMICSEVLKARDPRGIVISKLWPISVNWKLRTSKFWRKRKVKGIMSRYTAQKAIRLKGNTVSTLPIW